MSVERVFKFVGSVPQGDDVKRKDLLVCFLRSATDSNRYVDILETWEMCLCKKGVYFLKVKWNGQGGKFFNVREFYFESEEIDILKKIPVEIEIPVI